MRKAAEISTQFAPTDQLDSFKNFFFVGIGGAGMSPLAHMLLHRGFFVRGSDAVASQNTADLVLAGASVHIGHSEQGIEAGMAMVLTDAIDLNDSPEVAASRKLGIPLFRRSQVLGWLLRRYRLIAVTGTHGKTTTTGMAGSALSRAGFDPTVVVGAVIPAWGSAVREGGKEWAVAEACEAYDSYHDLEPEIVILTNLAPDHLDYHQTYENLKQSITRFCAKAKTLVYCDEDEGACEIARSHPNAVPYTLAEHAGLYLPGRHNLLNASGAVRACTLAGASESECWEGVKAFGGAERRLQVLQEGEITVVDDYAHHPEEIRASIQALREKYPSRRLVVVYQPHLYSRTEQFLSEFATELNGADIVVLTDIYPAREAPIPGISSARIAEKLTVPHQYVPARQLLARDVARWVEPGDVVCGMGAGNIQEFAPGFIAELKRKGRGQLKIVVAKGGDSAEREVSKHSGAAIAKALRNKGHDVIEMDLTEQLLGKGDLSLFIGPDRPDLVFLGVHGTNAEDGAIQGLLELLHVPYTGSNIQSSAIAMDKNRSKAILEANGIRVPKGQLVYSTDEPVNIHAPLIVKPNAQGSTVGLSFVEQDSDIQPAIERSLSYDSSVLVEEWIRGMEISVPVLEDRALPPVEIAPKNGRYDFASKYEPGATEEIIPARLAPEVIAQVQEIAVKCHKLLGCRGATRTDMIVENNKDAVVLEVNTLPGMTATSLLPNSARVAGLSMEDLCDWLVQSALRSYAKT